MDTNKVRNLFSHLKDLQTILSVTLTRPSTSVSGKVNGEGQMFTSADKAVYEEYLSYKTIHKEQVLKIANNSLKFKELTSRQKELTRENKAHLQW